MTSGKINNPNVTNPYGTQTVEWGKEGPGGFDQKSWQNAYNLYLQGGGPYPEHADYTLDRIDTDVPTITQTFSPEQQAIFDASNKAKLGMSELAGQGTDALKGLVGTNVDFSGAPPQAGQSEDVRKRVLAGMMSRVNEDYGRQSDDLNSQLVAAGLRPGSKAYDDQMALLTRKRTDANTQAELAAQQATTSQFGLDTQARKDAIAEMLMERQVPLNEITALLSGSQVSNPFAVPGYAQNANVGAAPVYGATTAMGEYNTDLYNVDAAQAGNLQKGLFGLGAAGVGAYGSSRQGTGSVW